MNPCVFNPADGCDVIGAYEAKAAKDGVKVPAKERKKAPYAKKTTDGKALPRSHSSRAATTSRNPPKK